MSDETARLLREILQAELHSMQADIKCMLQAQQQDGLRLAAIDQRCADRRQHCSAEFAKLGGKTEKLEDTGVHNLMELAKREAGRATLRSVVQYAIVALTAAGTVCAIWASVAKPNNHKRAPAPVVDARR